MSRPVQIAIADDHALLRQGMIALLKEAEGVTIVGEMASGEEAVNFTSRHKVDVFLLDIVMAGMTGIEATRWIKEQTPQVKVILISSEVNKDFISAGIKSGIDGYLNKDIDLKTLVRAIDTVSRGERYFSPAITALVFQDFHQQEQRRKDPLKSKAELTKKEDEVLILIAEGKSDREIAENLFVSTKTVEINKIHIQDKLGLGNTAQLVKYAIARKLEMK